MELLDTEYKRKSAILTAIIMGIMLFLIFTFGLKYLDPPEEYGIAVNFGTSDVGSGNTQSEPGPSSSASQEEVEEVEEVVEEVEEVQETPTEAVVTPSKAEDVITNDNAESIKINKQKEAERKAEATKKRIEDAKRKADREAKQKADQIRKQKAAEKAAKEAKEAKDRAEKAAKREGLDGMFDKLGKGDGTGGTGSGGDGDDGKAGDKGNPNGDKNASGYYGNGGGGSGGNYRLGNRKATSTPKPTYDCNEQGKVVVSISVDKSGRVLAATAGIKGTTNSAPCLLKRAKEAALKTKFNSDTNAPSKQVGSIIYNFSLSN